MCICNENIPQKAEDQLYQELVDWWIKTIASSFYIPLQPTEKLIDPKDYTPEIVESIERIKWRMDDTSTYYTDSDIIVVEYGSIIYILANPILSFSCDEEWGVEPGRNIQFVEGRLIVRRPELCERITT